MTDTSTSDRRNRLMTPSELRSHGEKLFGTRWQSKLAAELPVSNRTIRYWLSGERMIRPVIAARIRSLRKADGN